MIELIAVLEAAGISHEHAVELWQPFALHVLGIVLYSVFIFEFYRFISRKDLFQLELQEYARGLERVENLARIGLYVVQYLFLFPVLTIIWFLVFTGVLAPLADIQSIDALLLLTMSVVTAIRVTAYYHRDLAQDLAKMLPLALLGVFIVEGASSLTVNQALDLVYAIPTAWETIAYYLLFLVILEFLLRAITIFQRGTIETEDEEEADQETEA